GAVLHLRHLDALDERTRETVLDRAHPGLILSARTAWPFHDRPFAPVEVAFPVADYETRKQLWHEALAGDARLNGPLPSELAGRFRLTPGQVARAAGVARRRAWLRDGPAAAPEPADLYEGCRRQSNPALDRL